MLGLGIGLDLRIGLGVGLILGFSLVLGLGIGFGLIHFDRKMNFIQRINTNTISRSKAWSTSWSNISFSVHAASWSWPESFSWSNYKFRSISWSNNEFYTKN